MHKETAVGLVGVGKLGKAIASKLSNHCSLYVCDVDEEAAQRVSSSSGCGYNTVDSVIANSKYLFLALPPDSICKFCIENSSRFQTGSILLNLATSVETHELIKCINREDIRVVGLKPVCQSTALEQGQKTIFVTDSDLRDLLEELELLVQPLGTIQFGNEWMVKNINEAATRRAMELIIHLQRELLEQGVEEELIEAAVRVVAVGTLLDYPYREVNGYIANVLRKYDLQLT